MRLTCLYWMMTKGVAFYLGLFFSFVPICSISFCSSSNFDKPNFSVKLGYD